jgi:AcrR family transcriptional regulator
MAISRLSLYACFGSKEGLFKRALARHARRHLPALRRALAEPTARCVTEQLLREAMTNARLADGIGSFIGILSAMPDDPDLVGVREEIMAYRLFVIAALKDCLAEAQQTGEIATTARPDALAFLIEALSHGVAVRARSGVPDDLEALVGTALAAVQHAGGWAQSLLENNQSISR